MASPVSVALAGATGNIGVPILTNLLASGHAVTVLTRTGSKSTSTLPSHRNLTIAEVDYTSVSSLQKALTGIEAVISTIASPTVGGQNTLIDAAVASGVKRFIPSEFGSDTSNPNAKVLPVYAGKVATQDYLKAKAAEHGNFTYTLLNNQLFLDFSIRNGFLINVKKHTANLYDGGARPVSYTRLDTVGKAVMSVLAHLDETKNRVVYVHDTAVSQLELIEIVKKIDGKEWTTTEVDLAQKREEASAELKKGKDADVGAAMRGFIISAIWADGYGNDFSHRLDNELLGIKEMTKEEIAAMIRGIMEESGGA